MATAKLVRTEVGVVGEKPGIVLLTTEDTYDEIIVPGYINSAANTSEVNLNPTDFVLATYPPNNAIDIFRVEISNGVITLDSILGGGGGGGQPPYINTYWVAKSGDDNNDGKSIGEPKLTINGVLSSLENPLEPNVINIVDSGNYSEVLLFDTDQQITINAPAATLVSSDSGVPTITNNSTNSSVIAYNISGNAGPAVLNNTLLDIKANQVSGDIQNIGNIVQSILNLDLDTFIGNFLPNGGIIRGYIKRVTGDFNAIELPNNTFDMEFGSWTGDFNAQNTLLQLNGRSINGTITLSETSPNLSKCTGFIGAVPLGFSVDDSTLNQKTEGQFGNKLYQNTPDDSARTYGNVFHVGQVNGAPKKLIFKTDTSIVNLNSTNYETYFGAYLIYTGATQTHFFIDNDLDVPIGFRMTFLQGSTGRIGTIPESNTVPISESGQLSNFTNQRGSWMEFGKLDNEAEPLYYNIGDLSIIFNRLIPQTTTVDFSGLSGASQVSLAGGESGIQYRIIGLTLNMGTNFSGGDRDIAIRTATNVYSVIPSATLLALSNARWGDTALPAPVGIGFDTLTAAGENLYAEYSGGTTDYTAGSTSIDVIYTRVT